MHAYIGAGSFVRLAYDHTFYGEISAARNVFERAYLHACNCVALICEFTGVTRASEEVARDCLSKRRRRMYTRKRDKGSDKG